MWHFSPNRQWSTGLSVSHQKCQRFESQIHQLLCGRWLLAVARLVIITYLIRYYVVICHSKSQDQGYRYPLPLYKRPQRSPSLHLCFKHVIKNNEK